MHMALMVLRLAAQVAAGWLIARGWIAESEREAVIGLIVMASFGIWSWRATQAAHAAVPPEAAMRIKLAEDVLAAAMRGTQPPR